MNITLPSMVGRVTAAYLLIALFAHSALATTCDSCAEWNESRPGFKIYGDTYYVGVGGLSSILIVSAAGDILIDGDLPESAPKIAANIRQLGFDLKNVKLILNSHDHFDHAGGLAELQRSSGAAVAASPASARVLMAGRSQRDDPQYGSVLDYAPVPHVRTVRDGETLRVGPIAITAHFTPGHTPGGTSWTWQSCEGARCLAMVYADSLTPLGAPGFKFSDTTKRPNGMADFEKSYATLAALPCDILLTPHPGVSNLFTRLEHRDHGKPDAFIDPSACRDYVDRSRQQLTERLSQERSP